MNKKYYEVVLGLLTLLLVTILCFFIINCISREELLQRSISHKAVDSYKYNFIVIENTQLRDDEEFKAFVEKQVRDTGYVDISYDTVVRLHKTYLIRAWVFYKKVKK